MPLARSLGALHLGLAVRLPPFYRNKGHATHALYFYGVGGSRTRVQKPVPRPSTIVVHLLIFPLPDSGGQLSGFGSFMIRIYAQSFAYTVSCLDDASLPEGRYPGLTAAKR